MLNSSIVAYRIVQL